MDIIRGIGNLPQRLYGSVITIGNFDGIHLGHQAVFRTLRGLADHHGVPAMAVTFEPHPRSLVAPDRAAPPRITGLRGKALWMGRCGVNAMLVLRFTRELAALPPERFVHEFLVSGLGAREVLVGFNFRFGAGGRGTFTLLQELGNRFGFGVHRQDAHRSGSLTISSTRIREFVAAGDFESAERLLGRPFEIDNRVVGGHKRGRGLGFPTANLSLAGRIHPPPGVYVVSARVDDQLLPGVANLGCNPTFGNEGMHLEVHLLADCGDLYRRHLQVRFHRWLREEIRFSGPAALKARIAQDVAEARAYFADRLDDRESLDG
ncbi:MAG: bifunctional riboflavin kinase/FAD synthetase [Magnetococcales bacterium]|nr:bifunctional riboflavin kinase/FAD synthetase [Magnetococcales bacterium]